MFWIASFVADGGVFSLRIDLRGGRFEGLRAGVSLKGSLLKSAVGVSALDGLGELASQSLTELGVPGREYSDSVGLAFSNELFKLFRLPVCSDCRRLCCGFLVGDLSGDLSCMALMVYGLMPELSRALSASACAAAATCADVFGRVGERFGLAGFSGRGGGARSGSELSHLCLPSRLVSDFFIEIV